MVICKWPPNKTWRKSTVFRILDSFSVWAWSLFIRVYVNNMCTCHTNKICANIMSMALTKSLVASISLPFCVWKWKHSNFISHKPGFVSDKRLYLKKTTYFGYLGYNNWFLDTNTIVPALLKKPSAVVITIDVWEF